MAKRVALYLRVSPSGQTVEDQQHELAAAAERHGWQVVTTYTDAEISGAKGRDMRPAYDRLCKGIAGREFDMIAAWSVDRLGRSLQELVAFLGELHSKGIDVYLCQQGLDTSTPAGKAMFQMMGVFTEFERAMIVERRAIFVERVKSGVARARARGKSPGRPMIPAEKEAAIRAALATGAGMLKVAKMVGVGSGTVQRIKAGMAATQ
jgi:DNA invertase Pin-like site-specific DNA recombinase